jgi:hypothetical protein
MRLEAATFGSEFVVLLICKELSVALRYKLRASIPESTLTMKHKQRDPLPFGTRGSGNRDPRRNERSETREAR